MRQHNGFDLVAIALLLAFSFFWMVACVRAWRRIDSDADLLGQRSTELAEEMAEVDQWRGAGSRALLELKELVRTRHVDALIAELEELLAADVGESGLLAIIGEDTHTYDGLDGSFPPPMAWLSVDAPFYQSIDRWPALEEAASRVVAHTKAQVDREYFGQPDEIPGAL